MTVLSFAVLTTLIQIASAYLRFLPFRKKMTAEEIHKLWQYMLLWSMSALLLYLLYLSRSGVHLTSFKVMFFLGWIPYVALSVMVIRHQNAQHVFVVGMQGLWSFMLHSLSGMILAALFGAISNDVIHYQTVCYLILFLLLFPWEKKMFENLLPTDRLLDDSPLRWYVAALPIAIFLGALIPVVHITFLPEWKDRLARLALPLFFFLIYSTMSFSSREAMERMQKEHANKLMRQQRDALKRRASFMKEAAEHISVLRHDLRHSYRMIYTLLKNGVEDMALEHIRTQEEKLQTLAENPVSAMPLIDATIAIYLRQARELGIPFRNEVHLPCPVAVKESDLALLLSNLLEEAFVLQEEGGQEIRLGLHHDGQQCRLEFRERQGALEHLDENSRAFLDDFVEKYGVRMETSEEGGWHVLSLQWGSRG
ncbi:MAG: hypothetical protein IJT01_11105 [Selenomonadaceae bacterium]|nr:hypothetical protein [Selenomonadaceae bacterium]